MSVEVIGDDGFHHRIVDRIKAPEAGPTKIIPEVADSDLKTEKGLFEKYLSQKGLTDMSIYDLSNSWWELPMDKLTEYKAGEKDLPFQWVK